ncbi:transcriptional activator NhaR [Candidatus Sumerlaeota bacterium]|nr:transcriptional activator NhaR [Candidatus Sumerlaeota bacterium]
MNWLNYHHLLYFWSVARAGTIAEACKSLRLAQPTISAQLRLLEESIGKKLFARQGRRLVLTEEGQIVYRYANEIFSLGREMTDAVQGRVNEGPLRLNAGVADVLPKMAVYKILEPALSMKQPVRLACYEGSPAELLPRLAVHELDVVLSDSPVDPQIKIRAFSHFLGECHVSIFGVKSLADRYRRGFPRSLAGAPMLLPLGNTSLRRALDYWFDSDEIHPKVVGEFDDKALLRVFGQSGFGLFIGSTPAEREIKRQYQVEVVGRLKTVRERFYAITVERKVKHPAVSRLIDARRKLW